MLETRIVDLAASKFWVPIAFDCGVLGTTSEQKTRRYTVYIVVLLVHLPA